MCLLAVSHCTCCAGQGLQKSEHDAKKWACKAVEVQGGFPKIDQEAGSGAALANDKSCCDAHHMSPDSYELGPAPTDPRSLARDARDRGRGRKGKLPRAAHSAACEPCSRVSKA